MPAQPSPGVDDDYLVMSNTDSRLRPLSRQGRLDQALLDAYTDPATITAASRLGLAAALLSGVGLVLLALV